MKKMMKRIFSVPTAWRLGGTNGSADIPVRIVAGLTPAFRRAATMLLLCVFTTATAWAIELTNELTVLTTGNYIAPELEFGGITYEHRLTVDGDVTLTLSYTPVQFRNGIELTPGSTLTIDGPTADLNYPLLTIFGAPQDKAGIAVTEGCTLIINGGWLKIQGGLGAAGIGGGHDGSAGTIIINDGVVKAKGGARYEERSPGAYQATCYSGADIGCGGGTTTFSYTSDHDHPTWAHNGTAGGNITINGGKIDAYSIGDLTSKESELAATVTINGGIFDRWVRVQCKDLTLNYSDANSFLMPDVELYPITLKLEKNFKIKDTSIAYEAQTITDENVMRSFDRKGIVPCTEPLYAIGKGSTANGRFDTRVGEVSMKKAMAGSTVEVVTWPDNGYQLSGMTVTGTTAAISGNSATFTMPGENVTVTPAFSERNSYDITYNLNGGTQNPANPTFYRMDTGVASFAAPTRTGYTFDGWYDNSGFSGDPVTSIAVGIGRDITLWAKWSPFYPTVTFDANGGTGTMNSASVNFNSSYPLPSCTFTAPTGKEFDCWQVGTTQYQVGDPLKMTDNVTVQAVWKLSKVTVTFDTNGVEVDDPLAPQDLAWNTCATEPAEPTANGYEFVGWCYNGHYYLFRNTVKEDITLVARWRKVVKPEVEVTGIYIYTGQKIVPTITVKESDGTVIPASEYYVVTTNTTEAGTGTVTVVNLLSVDGNYTILPASQDFEIFKKPVTVSGIKAKNKHYDENKDAELDYSSVVINGKVSGDDLSVRAVGTFRGEDPGDQTVDISDLELIGNDADNYVLPEEGQQTTTATIYEPHTVLFESEDGEEFENLKQRVRNGEKATAPTLTDADRPTKVGYRFMDGWTLEGEPFDFDKALNFDETTEITLKPLFYQVYTIQSDEGRQVNLNKTEAVKGETVTMTAPTVDPYHADRIFTAYTIYYTMEGKSDDWIRINYEMTGGADNEATFIVPELPEGANPVITAYAIYSLNDNILSELQDASNEKILHIRSAADLSLLNKWLGEKSDGLAGKKLLLDNDIDLSQSGFSCFKHELKADFNGDGHTISGIAIDNRGSHPYNSGNAGFFYIVGGKVENLTLIGSVKGSYYVGGIAAFVGANAHIEHCVSLVNVESTDTNSSGSYYGGIAGQNAGSVEYCTYLGECTAGGSPHAVTAMGYGDGSTTDCTALYAIEGCNSEGLGIVTIGSATTTDEYDTVGSYFKAGSDVTLTLTASEREGYTLKGFMYRNAADEVVNLTANTPSGDGGASYTLAGISQNVYIEGNYAYNALVTLDQDNQNNYLIKTKADLEAVAQAVIDTNGCADMSFKLDNDLEDVGEFCGIAINASDAHGNEVGFDGTFDGAGHTISGMTISQKGSAVGFIGYFGGTLKNLTLKNCTVTNLSDYEYSYVGMLAGSGWYGHIENCLVLGGNVKGMNAGAVMGDCYVQGSNNLYDSNVTVVSGNETKAPGTCGTATYYGDISESNRAIVAWTVKFLDYDGETVLADEQLIADGNPVDAPATLNQQPATRAHFTLNEGQWVTAGGTAYNFNSDVHADIVLTPSYTEEETWTVSFAPNGGTGTMDNEAVYKSDAAAGWNLPWATFTAPAGQSFDQWEVVSTEAKGNAFEPMQFNSDIQLKALWKDSKVSFPDEGENSAAIMMCDGEIFEVMLADRTLYKDDKWNTLCLPFSISADELEDSPLSGAEIRELDTENSNEGMYTGLYGNALCLNFKQVYSIEAGKPYIIKWRAGDNLTQNELVFPGSTILNEKHDVTSYDGTVSFCGTYDLMTFTNEDRTILFVGSDNKLYYPEGNAKIGAQRAYFKLNGILAGDPNTTVRSFVLNFGDEEDTQGISSLTPSPSRGGEGSIYTLSGVKVDGVGAATVPARLRKGLYIHNGKKVVIK